NFFDGAAFGYASGHQQSQESAPPEDAIQEMKVITTTYSAQYGHTSGGFIEYVSKSGTNNLHGSAYEYFANDALNARGFFDADCDFSQSSGQLYNPYSNSGAGGARDPFVCDGAGNPVTPNANGTQNQSGNTPCNKIPTSLISTAGGRIAALMASPDRPGLFNNVA